MSIEIQPEENKEEVVDLHPDPIEVKSFDDATKTTNPVRLSNITRNLGDINAGSIKLSNAWHIDKNGNMWWGDYDTYDDAIIKISAAGVVNLTSGVFSGDISAATGRYLETFTAGENITQGDAVSTAGLFSQTSEADMLTDDTYVRQADPDLTGGGFNGAYVQFYEGEKKYALYKWNLANLITKSDEPQYEIISVTLHIKATAANIPIALYKITEDWSASTATWNNKPALGTRSFWSGTPDVGDNEIDITALYKEDANGPVYGFAFVGVSGGSGEWTILRTSEATAEPPYLVIYYRKRVTGEIYKAVASDVGCAYGFMGFADETKSATESIKIAISGIETHQSSLERGKKYYLSDTAGGISTSPGALYSDSIGIVVGKAISETKLLIYNDMGDAQAVGHKRYYRITSDSYKASDAEIQTYSTDYLKVKEFTLSTGFETQNLRIYFEMRAVGAGAYGKIMKNGAGLGTERYTTSGEYQPYTEDLLFEPGDTIELWIKTDNASYPVRCQNFRILGSNDLVPDKYDIETTL